MIQKLIETPIYFDYKLPTKNDIDWLKINTKSVNVEQNFRINAAHSYREIKLSGTQNIMLARQALVLKLNEILEILPNKYSFKVFDAFRTVETQFALFNYIYNQQKEINPKLSHSELYSITREFIIHPEETSRFAIPPHNSGGAIDLTLTCDGINLEMGTDFDAITPLSQTNYFEQEYISECGFTNEKWLEIRNNRRILFNAMKHVGFTNFQVEWWHYDLGDCMWAIELQQNWYYPSLEKELK
ncbi:M15 family metallopeptidase [Silvanigrella aquatica]|uniref:D-alanyl-D-alanine dipeptidase n=1 Tax=Silvanigrella aquatica TaxID=1915309 RepID=A0A1L4D452_9BACT|nr:M15 family metallopeptidase [Silvanigrella aquatica]APJ04981.1 hypothetical protein AXG55_14195 [Silvanigrella aquatica]